MREQDIQNSILNYLQAKGIFCWRNSVGGTQKKRYGLKGSADITGLLKNGRRLEIEVKSEKGKLSKEQKEFLEMINLNNGLAMVVRSLDDVINRV